MFSLRHGKIKYVEQKHQDGSLGHNVLFFESLNLFRLTNLHTALIFLYRELDNLQTAAHKSLYARLYTSGVVYNQRFFHNVNSSLIKVMFNPNMNNNK